MNDQFIQGIIFDWNKIDDDSYLKQIEALKDVERLEFQNSINFFVGENGSGKSTLLEAIAIAHGFNPEGGTKNYVFSTHDTHSELCDAIRVVKGYRKEKWGYFLRAESFYNFSSEVQRLVEEDQYFSLYKYYGGNLHNCSHGESFIKLVKNRFGDNGLYILDEPEAALSPERQMSLLCLIDDLVKRGCQFIIATHSPILISYYKGVILDLDNNFKITKYEDTKIYNLYRLYLDNPYGMQKRLFEGED